MNDPDIQITNFEPKFPRKFHTVWNMEEERSYMLKELLEYDKVHDTFIIYMSKKYPGKKFVGFWRKLPFEDSKLPWPVDLIDETQTETLLMIISDYLDDKKFFKLENGYLGSSQCRICGERLCSSDYEDEKWVWPEKLSHYVLKHKVKLPDEFIEHILTETGIKLYDVEK